MVKSGLLVNDFSGVTYDYSVLNADQLLALAVFKHLIIVLDFIVCMKCCVWFSQLIRFYISNIGAVPDYSLTHAVDITCYKITCSNFFVKVYRLVQASPFPLRIYASLKLIIVS